MHYLYPCYHDTIIKCVKVNCLGPFKVALSFALTCCRPANVIRDSVSTVGEKSGHLDTVDLTRMCREKFKNPLASNGRFSEGHPCLIALGPVVPGVYSCCICKTDNYHCILIALQAVFTFSNRLTICNDGIGRSASR